MELLKLGIRNSMEFGVSAMELLKFHGIPLNFCTGCGDAMEFNVIWCWREVPWNFLNSMEFHGNFVPGGGIPWNSMEFGVE